MGVDDRGPKRFLFKVSTHETYDRICDDFIGREIFVETGHKIRVEDISSYKTRVKISRVPFEVTNDILKKVLGGHGEVEKCEYQYKAFGKYKRLKETLPDLV